MQQVAVLIHSPRTAFKAVLLLVLLVGWLVLGTTIFATPIVDGVSQYDFAVFHAAGRFILQGGDPYSQAFVAYANADPHGTPYPYLLGSLWLLLPFLPLPVPLAATLWVAISVCGLLALGYWLGSPLPRAYWFAPLLFYPSLYALLIVQWAPLQMALLGISLWLWRRHNPFWAGFILPLVAVKPTTGLALLLFAAIFCARDLRWWRGIVVGGLVWYGLPLFIMPDWPLRWLASLRAYADPAAEQYLLNLVYTVDGQVCIAVAGAILLWAAWRRAWVAVACALLVLATLLTPHRAQYDFPILALPLLLLPDRHRWLVGAAVALSWGLPLSFELGWRGSLQLTLFSFVPAIVACALLSAPTLPPIKQSEQ